MKLKIPEISWHDTMPIYSCDVRPFVASSESKLILATGGSDKIVRIWALDSLFQSAGMSAHPLSNLERHEKPVNCVRWSHSGNYLATAGDDCNVIIWISKSDKDPNGESGEEWAVLKILRRHLEDVYDLSWAPDDSALISGSLDHSAIQWNLSGIVRTFTSSSSISIAGAAAAAAASSVAGEGVGGGEFCGPSLILKEHKHFVQGVAWDPLHRFVATQSSDRTLRIYKAGSRRCVARTARSRGAPSSSSAASTLHHLFRDSGWKSFFRRLAFSPDGLLLVCPAGQLAQEERDATTSTPTGGAAGVAQQHACHVFSRRDFSRPIVSIPTGKHPVIAVRFCGTPFRGVPPRIASTTADTTMKMAFEIATGGGSGGDDAIRWLFCIVLEMSVLICDTAMMQPFAQIKNIHYQALNDASWAEDGRSLVICSTDGYISIVQFEDGDLGESLMGNSCVINVQDDGHDVISQKIQSHEKKKINLESKIDNDNDDNNSNNKNETEKESCCVIKDDDVTLSTAQPVNRKSKRVSLITLTTELSEKIELNSPANQTQLQRRAQQQIESLQPTNTVDDVANDAAKPNSPTATKPNGPTKKRVQFITLE